MKNNIKIENNNFIQMVKGYVISLIVSLISLFIYAVILVNTNIQENTIKPVIITLTAISILIGSSISSLKIRKNGIINGIIVAIMYVLSLYILSSIAICGFAFNLSSIIMIVVGIIIGALGGIIGVNIGR